MSDKRVLSLFLTITMIFTVCLVRLAYWHLYKGNDMASKALQQQMEEVEIDCNRGYILDKNMVSLERTISCSRLLVFPKLITASQKNEVLDLVGEITVLEPGETRNEVLRDFLTTAWEEVHSIDDELVPKSPFVWTRLLVENAQGIVVSRKMPGLMIGNIRPLVIEASLGEQFLAAHTLGYCNSVGETDGINKAYNNGLVSPGSIYYGFTHDVYGQHVPALDRYHIAPDTKTMPYSVVTTLDRTWQETVEEVLYAKCGELSAPTGSVVAVDANTGGILAIASYPALCEENYNNYALKSYIPGSIFKVALVAAALNEESINWNEEYECSGEIELEDRVFRCWKEEGHGELTLEQVLQHSCNVGSVKIQRQIGNTVIMESAKKLGLGQRKILGLDSEESGQLPEITPYNEFNPNYAIGQGEIQVTPLQVAGMLGAIVNYGRYQQPYLIDRIIDKKGATVRDVDPPPAVNALSPSVAKKIQVMLKEAILNGTASGASVDGVCILGKTGSAEYEDHVDGWFAGAAKLQGKWVVVVVHISKGITGSDSAVPAFKEIVEKMKHRQ